jgi:hypothetical protein
MGLGERVIQIRKLLFSLLLANQACMAEAPWLNPVDPPPHADDAIAVSIQSLEQRTSSQLDFNVDIHWLQQSCIVFPGDNPEIDQCTTGFRWDDYWHPDCEIWVIWRGYKFSATSLAHELMHCTLAEEKGDPDVGHLDPWWSTVLKDVNADVAEWEDTLLE